MNKEQLSVEKQLKCTQCGCTGLHACTGSPIVWTEADKERFKKALDKFEKD